MEIVKTGTVNQGWKLAGTDPELVAHRRETETQVQKLATLFNKVVPEILRRIHNAGLFAIVPH